MSSIIMKTALPRRMVLRGMGATLALPLLDAMVPALTAQARTAAKPVPRFGVFYVPNGMSIGKGHWTPERDGADFELTTILKPLEGYRDQLVVLSGLTNAAANALPGEGAGDHARGPGSYLTGVHVKRTEGGDYRAGTSLDQIIAPYLGKETQLASLEMGLDSVEFVGSCDPGYSCVYHATISWRTPTTPLPMENDPRAVFDRLFGTSGTTDARARLAELHRDRSLLDALTGRVARLKQDLGSRDRVKIDQYLSAIRDVEQRLQRAEAQNERDLPVVERPTGIPTIFGEHIRMMFDLITLAYQADLTRVFTFLLAKEMGAQAYPECGVVESHHGISHHQHKSENMEKLARINTYHMQTFTYLLEKLKSTPDGDGSLLDHTIINYGGGIGDSDTHAHDNLPVLLLGGGAGRLKGGRHLRFAKDTPLTNMHVTLLDMLDVPMESFGDSSGRLDRLAAV